MFFQLLIMTALTVFTVPFHAAPAQAESNLDKLVAHKALYEIELVSKKSSSQILNISGQMFFEWEANCEAWTTNHRFTLYYDYADSPPLQINSDFSTYETFDGKDFSFSSRRERNGNLYQEIRGHASAEDDGSGQALYSLPEDLVFDLKKGNVFPMTHTLDLLDKAQAGKKFFSASVFDGSDEDGPVEINAFIGQKVNAMAKIEPAPELDTTLLNTPAWNVRMAFFPLQNEESDAEYEMEVIFHENGIISDMLVEYRDFSVTQKLVALEKLPEPECNGIKKVSDTPKSETEKPPENAENQPKDKKKSKFKFWGKD